MTMQIPEHTWGFDTKTFLHDNANWANKDFHAQLDAHAQNYEDNIAQWQRQRGYMTWALEALDLSLSKLPQASPTYDSDHKIASDPAAREHKLSLHDAAESARVTLPELSLAEEQLRSELRRHHELTDIEGYEQLPVGEPMKLKSQFWEIEVNTSTGKALSCS